MLHKTTTLADRNAYITSPWAQITPLIELGARAAGAVQMLREFARMPQNWDGYDSPPLTTGASHTAMELLAAIGDGLAGVRIAPVSGGGVQFEWHIGARELELEILPEGSVQFLIVEGGQMQEGDVVTRATLEALLRWLWRC
jgi:hypothetical protein